MKNDMEAKKLEIIAGPCSAESREQVLATARQLRALGIGTFRAGLWKPRSRPGAFEGCGAQALPWLQEVQGLGMRVMTEVGLPEHVEAALAAGVDGLWIGARTVVNPFLMDRLAEVLAGTEVPVFVKNPVCPDLELWTGAVERLLQRSAGRLTAIFRGFCVEDSGIYRNAPLWRYVRLFRERFPQLPVYCDPSHIAGRRELVGPLCREAAGEGVDGFFIESHVEPDAALSDARQQLTPAELGALLAALEREAGCALRLSAGG